MNINTLMRVERKDITYKRKDIAVTVRMKVIIPSHLHEKILKNKITGTENGKTENVTVNGMEAREKDTTDTMPTQKKKYMNHTDENRSVWNQNGKNGMNRNHSKKLRGRETMLPTTVAQSHTQISPTMNGTISTEEYMITEPEIGLL